MPSTPPPAPSLSPDEQAQLARGRALLDGLIRMVRQAAPASPARDDRQRHD